MDWSSLDVQYKESGSKFVIARPALLATYYGADSLIENCHFLVDRWLSRLDTKDELYYLGPRGRAFRPIDSKKIRRLLGELLSGKTDYLFIKDAPEFDIGHWSIELAFYHEAPARMYAAYPIDILNSATLADVKRDFSESLGPVNPSHATLGLGFSIVFGREFEQVATVRIAAMCARFLGFDLPDRYTERLLSNKIKGAAWMTYLCGQFVDRLGEHAVKSLESEQSIHVSRVASGLLFQAGDAPPMGDANRGATDLASLKILQKRLKPLCFDRWDLSPLTPENTTAQFEQWLSRLD